MVSLSGSQGIREFCECCHTGLLSAGSPPTPLLSAESWRRIGFAASTPKKGKACGYRGHIIESVYAFQLLVWLCVLSIVHYYMYNYYIHLVVTCAGPNTMSFRHTQMNYTEHCMCIHSGTSRKSLLAWAPM